LQKWRDLPFRFGKLKESADIPLHASGDINKAVEKVPSVFCRAVVLCRQTGKSFSFLPCSTVVFDEKMRYDAKNTFSRPTMCFLFTGVP
jgi:hypothetical protein